MANWWDVIALITTLAVFSGVIIAVVIASKQVKQSVESTKEALKSKGLHISDKGVSVKTARHFDRGDYVDATQRGIIKAMSASSFGQASPDATSSPSSSTSSGHLPVPAPVPVRQNSTPSNSPVEEKKKRGLMRRAFSVSKES